MLMIPNVAPLSSTPRSPVVSKWFSPHLAAGARPPVAVVATRVRARASSAVAFLVRTSRGVRRDHTRLRGRRRGRRCRSRPRSSPPACRAGPGGVEQLGPDGDGRVGDDRLDAAVSSRISPCVASRPPSRTSQRSAICLAPASGMRRAIRTIGRESVVVTLGWASARTESWIVVVNREEAPASLVTVALIVALNFRLSSNT